MKEIISEETKQQMELFSKWLASEMMKLTISKFKEVEPIVDKDNHIVYFIYDDVTASLYYNSEKEFKSISIENKTTTKEFMKENFSDEVYNYINNIYRTLLKYGNLDNLYISESLFKNMFNTESENANNNTK